MNVLPLTFTANGKILVPTRPQTLNRRLVMKLLSSGYAGSLGLAVRGRNLRLALLLTTLLTFSAVHALAQEATIVGTVTDSSAAVVPGAVVTIKNVDTGTTRSLTTNGDGQYAAPSLG